MRTIALLCFVFIFLLFAACTVFSVFYLCSSYQSLLAWYFRLNSCFYLSAGFATDFFTPAVKAAGNLFCVLSIVLSGAGIVASIRKIKDIRKTAVIPSRVFNLSDYGYLISAGIILTVLWYWGEGMVRPYNDEIFSAVNGAGDHPFHTLSYYMLPNNHVLYNVLNGVLFHNVTDKVFSGRLLSLAAYLALAATVYYWFCRLLKRKGTAFLAMLVVVFHLPVWAYSFQARGYEFYLLMEWIACSSCFYYYRSPSGKWLMIHLGSIIAGYAFIPSFMYCHAAIVVFMLLLQIAARKADYRYWKYLCAAVAGIFLFYLPVICFSGAGALAANRYILPVNDSYPVFLSQFRDSFTEYMKLFFNGDLYGYFWPALTIFSAPLLLLFSRQRRQLGLFFLVFWLVCIAMILGMKRYCFPRNLIGHISITLGLLLVTIHDGFYWLAARLCVKKASALLFPALLAGLLILFFEDNKKKAPYTLYGNVNEEYENTARQLAGLPYRTIGCSDANFFFYYLLKMKGYNIEKCISGHEAYLIREKEEQFDPAILSRYTVFKEVNNCIIYRRNGTE